MFAPAIKVDGAVVFINPEHISHMQLGEPLEEIAPDGNPWPTTNVYLSNNPYALQLKGSPQMILNSWFGPATNSEPPPPQSRIVMPGLVKIPARGRVS